jgi:hypothetical protein
MNPKIEFKDLIVETKRQYFVYFYGKYLEYAWISTRSLINYAGLNNFIQNAESAVQQVDVPCLNFLIQLFLHS